MSNRIDINVESNNFDLFKIVVNECTYHIDLHKHEIIDGKFEVDVYSELLDNIVNDILDNRNIAIIPKKHWIQICINFSMIYNDIASYVYIEHRLPQFIYQYCKSILQYEWLNNNLTLFCTVLDDVLCRLTCRTNFEYIKSIPYVTPYIRIITPNTNFSEQDIERYTFKIVANILVYFSDHEQTSMTESILSVFKNDTLWSVLSYNDRIALFLRCYLYFDTYANSYIFPSIDAVKNTSIVLYKGLQHFYTNTTDAISINDLFDKISMNIVSIMFEIMECEQHVNQCQ